MKVSADIVRKELELDVVRKRKHYPLEQRGVWEEEYVVAFGIKGGEFKCVVVKLQREIKDCDCYNELYEEKKLNFVRDTLSKAEYMYNKMTGIFDSLYETTGKTR